MPDGASLPPRPLRRLAAEAACWAVPVVVFLTLYIGRYGMPAASISAHLRLVGALLAALVAVRLLLWRLPGLPAGPRRGLGVALSTAAWAALVGFYVLALLGLAHWGHVTSWRLVRSYAAQAPMLAGALGLDPGVIAAAALAGLLVLGWAAYRLMRVDWVAHWVRQTDRRVVDLAIVAGVCFAVLALLELGNDPPVRVGEPFSLSLFPERARQHAQSSALGANPLLQAQAEADRQHYPVAPPGPRRNVVLIVVDALRPDRLGVLGATRDTTPFLSSLQRNGVISHAQRVQAVCAESYCGLLGIARSKYVHQLSGRDFSLHEALRRQGYRVQMILGGDHTNFYGLRQAYGTLDGYTDASDAPGYYVNDDRFVVERVKALPRWDGRPFVLQLHLMSAHPLARRNGHAAPYQPAEPYVRSAAALPERSERALNHYDNGVRQMDAVVADVVAALGDKGYLRDTLFVLTADHGEMLGEHGEFGHAGGVFEPALAVPLLLGRFGYRAAELPTPAQPASQVDIAPTVLTELGLPIPASWSGTPLQARTRPVLTQFQQGRQVGLYQAGPHGQVFKYWQDLASGREKVFELSSDPAESRDRLADADPAHLEGWRTRLLPTIAAAGVLH